MKTLSKIKIDVIRGIVHRTVIRLKRKEEIYPSSVVKVMQKNLNQYRRFWNNSRITLARALIRLVKERNFFQAGYTHIKKGERERVPFFEGERTQKLTSVLDEAEWSTIGSSQRVNPSYKCREESVREGGLGKKKSQGGALKKDPINNGQVKIGKLTLP